jgi:hypothetical protein
MSVTPRRGTGRVSGVPRRVGRVLEHAVQSESVYDPTLTVSKTGRLGVNAAPDGGLVQTREGLALSPSVVGEKNRPQMNRVDDLASGASASTIATKVNEILAELRRTTHMRGSSGL